MPDASANLCAPTRIQITQTRRDSLYVQVFNWTFAVGSPVCWRNVHGRTYSYKMHMPFLAPSTHTNQLHVAFDTDVTSHSKRLNAVFTVCVCGTHQLSVDSCGLCPALADCCCGHQPSWHLLYKDGVVFTDEPGQHNVGDRTIYMSVSVPGQSIWSWIFVRLWSVMAVCMSVSVDLCECW
jgi:hypothetical protein